jgi:SET domain-containing protein
MPAPEYVCFRESAIHGTGGFAAFHIPAGARVIEYIGRRIDKQESLRQCELGNPYIFSITDEYDLDGNVDWNPARLLNHSCTPNCAAEEADGRIWIVASRDIKAGEEITFNYNFDLEAYQEHPCQCGSTDCVGYIVAEEFFATLRLRLAESV